MALVTITGTVKDHSNVVIHPDQQPELWFRPDGPRIRAGLLAGVEVKANLTAGTGAFTVPLESDGDEISYVPFLRWLVDPSQTDPEKRAFGYAEMPRIWPDTGGPIGDLIRPATGWVYCSPFAPVTDGTIRAEFQYNTTTTALYRRVIS